MQTHNAIHALCEALDTETDQDRRDILTAQIRSAASSMIDPSEVREYRAKLFEKMHETATGYQLRSQGATAYDSVIRLSAKSTAFLEARETVLSVECPLMEATPLELSVEDASSARKVPQPFEVFSSRRSASNSGRRVAEGVIFSNGSVAASWIEGNPRQRLYASMDDFRQELFGDFSILYPARHGQLVQGITSPTANAHRRKVEPVAQDSGNVPTPMIFANKRRAMAQAG